MIREIPGNRRSAVADAEAKIEVVGCVQLKALVYLFLGDSPGH